MYRYDEQRLEDFDAEGEILIREEQLEAARKADAQKKQSDPPHDDPTNEALSAGEESE